MVLAIGRQGRIRPAGVWAGASWEDIGREIKQGRGEARSQYQLLLSTGIVAPRTTSVVENM